jgi:hypothetical protein
MKSQGMATAMPYFFMLPEEKLVLSLTSSFFSFFQKKPKDFSPLRRYVD